LIERAEAPSPHIPSDNPHPASDRHRGHQQLNVVVAAATSTTSAAAGLMAPVMTDEGMAALCPVPDECSLAMYLTGLQQVVIYLLASSEMSRTPFPSPLHPCMHALFTAPASKLGLAERWCMHASLLISFLFN
jgi:hypothetical protein